MKTLKTIFLFILVISQFGCSTGLKSDGIDYFSKSKIEIPKFSNEAINNHLSEYTTQYNLVCSAVTSGDTGNAPQLSISFSDWAITALKIEDNLKGQERKDYNTLLEMLAKRWNEQKDKLQ